MNWRILYGNYRHLIELSDSLDVRDELDENIRLAEILGIREPTERSTIQGRFGNFFRMTNCLIPYYFIWS